ncbi:MAG: hypothetical protein ACLGI2_06730 [Acidimicrobiia bacterium]
MTALLRAEARKALTTRSALVVAGLAAVYPALALLPAVLAPEPPDVDAASLLDLLRGGADVLAIAALLLGILAVAGEYRHGTIVPTLLATPRRPRLMAAKVGFQAAMAAVLAVVAGGVGVAAGGAYLSSRGVSFGGAAGDVALTAGAVVAVAALYATLGAALAGVVRNQTAAVTGALLWVFAAENALPLLLRNPGLDRWMPGGAADRLLAVADGAAGSGDALAGLGLLAGVAAVLAVAAVASLSSTDIS